MRGPIQELTVKKILSPAILALALAGTSSQAAEFGILVDRQFGKDQTIQGINGSGTISAIEPTGMGFRLGVGLMDLKFAELGATVTYHPKSTEDFMGTGSALPLGKYGTEYWALGAQIDWKLLVNLHAGVDVRQEKYTSEYNGVNSSTSQTRPWIKAGIGFGLPLPVVTPFIRLEVAAPFTKSSKTGTTEDNLKALAAEYQVALYGGIRF